MNKFLKIIGAVAIINIVARLIGFLREVAISNQYGLSDSADAIATAYTFPNFIYLVVGGALTTAFISVYHSTREDKAIYVRKAFATILIAAVAITTLFVIFADPLFHTFFRKLTGEKLALTKSLYYWMMPSSIFLVLATWMSGLLNVNGKFNLSSFSILIYNGSFLVIAVLLSSVFGPESYGIGAFFGAVFMAVFLFSGLQRSGLYSLKPAFKMSDDVNRLWVIALPILFGGASLQFYFIIHRIAADTLGEGSIAAVNFASKLSGFPQAIMMTAVTTVIYPLLSKKEGEGDMKTIRSLYKKGLLLMTALVIPVTVFMYIFAEPIVSIVFGSGSSNFGEEDIQLTTPIFRVFTLSMFFLAANTYITRFYYAKGNSMAPVIFSLISVFGINIAIIYMMIDTFGASAIAYGTVISAFANFVMLAVYARVKWKL